jgi:tetratricopeptide (TPR) repeat protein
VHEIFISYSSQHRVLTRALASAIEARYGAGSVWWDIAIESWGDFEVQIRNALHQARAVVVIWTREAGESDWVKSEAGRASRDGKLINVRAPGLLWRDVPMPFDQHHFRDLDETDDILRLIQSVWTGTPAPTAVPLYEIYFRHHDRRLIDPRQSQLAHDSQEISPVELLQARSVVVPYTDVTGMKAGLLRWCRDGARATAGRLVHGPGGLGKTRLLIEVANELREAGWMAGFLDPPYTDNVITERRQALDQLIAYGDDNGLLIVVDYAESRQKELRELAGRLITRPGGDTRPIRLVLLTRTAGEWWTMLHDKTTEIQRLFRRDSQGEGVVALPAIATPEQRRALFFASAEAMAPTLSAKGYDIPAGEPSPGRLARIEHDAGHARPLAVQMEALLWLAAAVPDAGPVGVDQLLTGVLGLERDHWDKLLRDDRRRVSYLDDDRARDIQRGVAQVTVVQGTSSKASTERLLMADRFYGDHRRSRVAVDPILRDLLRLYGKPEDAGIRQLEPDLIGEHLVAMTADPELIDGCLAWIGEEPESQEKRRRDLLTVLQRATHPDHGPAAAGVSALLDHLVKTRTRDLAVDMVAVMTDTPGALLGRFEQRVDSSDEETLDAVNDALPLQSLTLMEFSFRIATRLADDARKTSTDMGAVSDISPEVHETSQSHLARRLSNLGVRVFNLGHREEALAASQEAVAIRRRLAETRPDAFLHDLGMSLNNISVHLSNLGRREEALAASQEAVAIYQCLAETRPDAFLPDLALSQHNLGIRLTSLGRREEALAASQEAIAIRRRLAEARPDAFLHDLGMSLHNISMGLSSLGQREEALAASQEAVAIYRRLAETRPDAFLPDLASSLNNISMDLTSLGRREEALAASQEAVAIRRRLAEIRSDAFLPDLASSLNNLGNCLSDLGRSDEGLAASQEAVAIHRRLAETRPDAFLPDLATSLNNISVDLFNLGRREPALAASREAVAIRRRLAETRPDAFLPDLAMSLNNVSVFLSNLGRHEEALAAAQEAVAARRRLAETRPEAFLPNLASSLETQGEALAHAGRHADAAGAFGEGLAILVPFVERHVQAFGGLAGSLTENYVAACEKAGTAPDAALLERVAQALDGGSNVNFG